MRTAQHESIATAYYFLLLQLASLRDHNYRSTSYPLLTEISSKELRILMR